jgi:hypothetical protein
MRERFWCGLHTMALALLPLVLGGHARAAENAPKVITLSCDGMLTPTYGANKPAMPQSARLVANSPELAGIRARILSLQAIGRTSGVVSAHLISAS